MIQTKIENLKVKQKELTEAILAMERAMEELDKEIRKQRLYK